MSLPVAIAVGWCAGLAAAVLAGPVPWIAWLALCTGVGAIGVGAIGVRAIGVGAIGVGAAGSVAIGGGLRTRGSWLLLMAAGCAGLATRVTHESPSPPRGLCRLTLDVERVERDEAGDARSLVRVVAGERIEDHVAVPVGTWLSVAPLPLPVGARVRVLGNVRPEQRFANPSPHPELPQAIPIAGRAWLSRDAGLVVVSQSWISRAIHEARAAIRAGLERSLPPHVAGVARALTLGEVQAVADVEREQVRAAGLSHVLAVSGLHVSIVIGLVVRVLSWLLCWTPLARRMHVARIACALGVPLVLGYAPLAGDGPSAWRAAITAAVAWSVVAFGRRPDAVAVTSLAVVALLARQPSDITSIGLWLSVAATAAIVSSPRAPTSAAAQPLPALRWLLAAWRITWRATLATAPITLWVFESLPIIGLLANLVLVPFSSVALIPLATVHALLAVSTPPVAALTAPCLGLLVDTFTAACAWCSHVPSFRVPPLSLVQLVLLSGLSLGLLSSRMRWPLGLLCMLGLCAAELHLRASEQPRERVRVTFLDVGQGDSALVDLPNGALMVIDTGGNPGGGPDPGRRVLAPLLRARRRSHVDVLVVTHPHPDHYGGVAALLEGGVSVGEVWDSGQAEAETPTGEWAAQLRALRARGARVLGPAQLCTGRRRFGAASTEVLWPCPGYQPTLDANDNSLVIRLEHAGHRVLFTGDVERRAEAALVSAMPQRLKADVLKVPHHGSRTSCSAAWLSAVAPQLAVVSAGAFNRFGHPHAEVWARLQRVAGTALRVDQVGAVTLWSEPSGLRFEAYSSGLGEQYMP